VPELPFLARLALLLVVLALLAGWDRWRHGAEARRAREYAFLLGCGALAAGLGALLDQLSVRISPHYFVLGKGVAAGPGLAWRAAGVGAQAGFVAGLVVGGVLLLVDQPRAGRPTLGGRALLRTALPWLLGAALLGEALGAALAPLDPLGLERELEGFLRAPARDRFVQVWGMHAGLYLGALAGLVLAAIRVVRARRRAAT
jgi:hypothetical protein